MSTLLLIKRATALATSGLERIKEVQDENHSPSNCPSACFSGYDDLVNARAMLELVRDVPSFEAELGRYSASLDLCLSILVRAISREREDLGVHAGRATHTPMKSSSSGEIIDVGHRNEGNCHGALSGRRGCEPALTCPSPGPTLREPQTLLKFDSIVGNATAKRTIFEHVVLPLKLSEEARSSLFGGIRSSGNNVLLHGPPGTGKTTIAEAASHEAGASFYAVSPSSILSKYQGESERGLSQLFDRARRNKPSIIFLDELDALAPSRDAQDDVQSRRLLAELLLQTSQLRPSDQIVVIGATNRIDDIDIALLRRFQSRVFVGPPVAKERIDMLVSFMEDIEHDLSQEQLATLSERLAGWSGSDIKSLCREACMGPLRSLYECEGELEKVITQRPTGTLSIIRPVHMSDCEGAYSFLMGSADTACCDDQTLAPRCDELVSDEPEVGVPTADRNGEAEREAERDEQLEEPRARHGFDDGFEPQMIMHRTNEQQHGGQR